MPADPSKPETYRPLLEVILDAAGSPELPAGYDTWGWKITRPDLRSYGRFRWPWPGGTVTDENAIPDGGPCPRTRTGGYCIAAPAAGAASGAHGHETILLLAYRQADVLARDDQKIRVRHCLVADVADARSVWRSAAGADLTGADLAGAALTDAYLTGANLTRADLTGANLTGADLTGANLAGANLAGAYLTGAYLTDAYLTDANLTDANLTRANLTRANLTRANLTRANLTRAKGLDTATGYKAASHA